MTVTPLDEHYINLNPAQNKDFRTFSAASRVLDLIGDESGRILDIGCGYGVLVALGQKRGLNVQGLDTSASMIKGSKEYLASLQLDRDLVSLTTIEDLIHKNAQYEVITMIDVLEHNEDSKGFLRSLEKLLAPGGRLILTVPAHPEFYDSRDELLGHFRRYTSDMLMDEMSVTGLHTEDIFYWNFLGWVERKFRLHFLSSLDTQSQYAFRYSRNFFSRLLNNVLRGYFHIIENRIRPSYGLTLILVAHKKQK